MVTRDSGPPGTRPSVLNRSRRRDSARAEALREDRHPVGHRPAVAGERDGGRRGTARCRRGGLHALRRDSRAAPRRRAVPPRAGVTGLIFGRNIWQRSRDESLRFVAALKEILAKYPSA